MNVSGIDFESIADGDGVRVVLFVSGCAHDCPGCHNPAQHSFTAGQPFTDELQEEIISYIDKTPFISGLTLSGGDPMYHAEEVASFLRKLRRRVPRADVWLYSGFTCEEILADETMMSLLSLCDVLVDGPYFLEMRDPTLPYRGSKNQRIIDVQKTLTSGVITLL